MLRAAEQDRPDVLAPREQWRAEMPEWDPERPVFLDETSATTTMTRRYGRSPRGELLIMPEPHGHWKTSTFVAALRIDGLIAPTVVDGAMNGDFFEAYVERQLIPTLRPGDVVVMDHRSSHKRASIRKAIEAAGCTRKYLPPYSPDLNPIEQAFSQVKSLLRKARERTVAGLWEFFGRLPDAFTPQECRNFIAHSGYAATST